MANLTLDSREYGLKKMKSMENLCKSLHSQASTFLEFTLEWKELEEHFESTRNEIQTQSEELRRREKLLEAKELNWKFRMAELDVLEKKFEAMESNLKSEVLGLEKMREENQKEIDDQERRKERLNEELNEAERNVREKLNEVDVNEEENILREKVEAAKKLVEEYDSKTKSSEEILTWIEERIEEEKEAFEEQIRQEQKKIEKKKEALEELSRQEQKMKERTMKELELKKQIELKVKERKELETTLEQRENKLEAESRKLEEKEMKLATMEKQLEEKERHIVHAKWAHLRVSDFETVHEYNLELMCICSEFQFLCSSEHVTDAQKIEKTLSTFPTASQRLSESYRKEVEAGSITSYSQLIADMEKAEKNNMALMKKRRPAETGGNHHGSRSSKKPRYNAYMTNKEKMATMETQKIEADSVRALAIVEPASISNVAAAPVKTEKEEQAPAATTTLSRPMLHPTATATSTRVSAPAAINAVAPDYGFTGLMHTDGMRTYHPNNPFGYSTNHGQLSISPSYINYYPEQFRMANRVGYNGGINQPHPCPPPVSYEHRPPGVGPRFL